MTAFNRTLPLRSLGILLVLSASPSPYLRAEDAALKITLPTEGTVVNPGETVVVYVEASGGPFKSVTIIAPGYVNGLAALNSPPYQFSFTVPPVPSKGIGPGINTITAAGSTASAVVFSSAVPIDIERSDSPTKFKASTSGLGMEIGERLPIYVSGTYSDGSIVDLTKSTQTTYVSQAPSIATVTNEGWVTAIAPGLTKILIDGSIAIPVRVAPPISITPTQRTLTASQTMEFVARVTDTANPGVTFQLNPAIGSITHDGIYTAPESLDSKQTVSVIATSVKYPNLTATATITLSPEAWVHVVPGYAVLYPAQPQQFTATTSNAGSGGVNWSIRPSGAGTISVTGLYTAPATIRALQTVTIVATSVAQPAISGSVQIYISPQPFALFLPHPTLELGPGAAHGIEVMELAAGRFWHPVALSVDGLPGGITAKFDRSALTGSGQTTLTFSADGSAVSGTYTVNVVAQDTVYPAMTDSKPVTLVIVGGSR
jgi:hypothetical protein